MQKGFDQVAIHQEWITRAENNTARRTTAVKAAVEKSDKAETICGTDGETAGDGRRAAGNASLTPID